MDDENVLHTSSDGKKIVVDVESLLANYSYKYFGRESGINVNNFLDPKQISFNVNILPSSDREAPHMASGLIEVSDDLWRLYNNKSDSISNSTNFEHLHYTDTHGYTEAIFAALWFKNILLQPHISKVWELNLFSYDSKTLTKNRGKIIHPSRAISHKKITSQWDDMLRIMCSVILGYCPTHQVFRQLSAGAAHFLVYKSFQELGRLIRTKNTLRYLTDTELQLNVRKYLNRIELSQRFGNAIFHGRKGKLKVGTHDEIQRAILCKTILMNIIIAWNYLVLSDHYHQLKSDQEKLEVSEKIRSGSVMAYEHINLAGELIYRDDIPHSFAASLSQMQNIKIMSEKKPL